MTFILVLERMGRSGRAGLAEMKCPVPSGAISISYSRYFSRVGCKAKKPRSSPISANASGLCKFRPLPTAAYDVMREALAKSGKRANRSEAVAASARLGQAPRRAGWVHPAIQAYQQAIWIIVLTGKKGSAERSKGEKAAGHPMIAKSRYLVGAGPGELRLDTDPLASLISAEVG